MNSKIGASPMRKRLGLMVGLAVAVATFGPTATPPDAYADAPTTGNTYAVQFSFESNRSPSARPTWQSSPLPWVLGGRPGVVAVNASSKDGGKTLVGTVSYAHESPMGFRASVQGHQLTVENQLGGANGTWHPGGVWRLGGRGSAPVVELSLRSTDGGKSVTGNIGYKDESFEQFKGTVEPPAPPPPQHAAPPPPAAPVASQFFPKTALKLSGNASARTSDVATTATTMVTIEAWVKADRANGTQTIAYNGDTGRSGYGIIVRDGVLQILVGGVAFVASTKSMDTSAWHHVAAVRDSSAWHLYVDGAEQSLSSATAAAHAPAGGFSVGSNNGGGEGFAGVIDEVRVWSVARTQHQIASNMKVILPAGAPGLTGYWRFDEGAGSVADNSVRSTLQLKLYGSPAWVPSEAGGAAIQVEATPGPDDVVEDVPDMSEQDVQQVMHWIKVKTTGVRLPFCWRQSSGRGVGTVPGRVADCPSSYTNNGATCGRSADTIGAPSHLASCPPDYTNMGLTCFKPASTYWKGCTTIFKSYDCNPGYTDNGCFCGRGADSISASHMTCEAGYHKSDITDRCIKDCPSGYTNTGETCFRGVSTLGMDAMTCHADEHKSGARCYPNAGACGANGEEDAGLCYPRCASGFNGVGPVCWQGCDSGWVNCGAACARTQTDCAMAVTNQVIAPLIVAANIATLGLDEPITEGAQAGERSLKIGSKTVSSNTAIGKALIKAINKLQSIKPAGTAKNASVFRRIYAARFGTKLRTVKTALLLADKVGYQATKEYSRLFADNFATMTSSEINSAIDGAFIPATARFLKETWANQQMSELASANAWNISQDTMAVVSMVDITGVTGVVSAYAQPICQDLVKMPCIDANKSYPNCK